MNRKQSQASSILSSVMTIPTQLVRDCLIADKERKTEFSLDAFLNSLEFENLVQLDDHDLELQLQEVDALDLFSAVQEVTRELANVKLENHFMQDFLEKNDPKLLIGLRQRRLTATSIRSFQTSVGRSTVGSATQSQRQSSRPSLQTAQSVITTTSSGMQSYKKTAAEYRLNYRTKTEMAEKTAADVDRRIIELESKAMQRIKMLNVTIEELRYTCAETEGTIKNFEAHFLNDESDVHFLQTASERQIESKLRKFVNNWLKNARALLATMRLSIHKLHESCLKHRSDLITKSHLSGNLGEVDFEKLIIKRNQLVAELEEKTNHLNGLKVITGKAALVMAEETKVMDTIEEESKRITGRTAEVLKAIKRLQREAKYIEKKNSADFKLLQYLQQHSEQYEAPSVSEYIERKAEISALEKEEKTLQRKISILNMKLRNTLARCNRRIGDINENESYF